ATGVGRNWNRHHVLGLKRSVARSIGVLRTGGVTTVTLSTAVKAPQHGQWRVAVIRLGEQQPGLTRDVDLALVGTSRAAAAWTWIRPTWLIGRGVVERRGVVDRGHVVGGSSILTASSSGAHRTRIVLGLCG